MVRNLLDNAERHGAPPIAVDVRSQGGNSMISVTDHGAGVSESNRERIFEPFFRTEGRGARGAGLGLALVRQIARQHGGEAVWAESADAVSGVRVTLPTLGHESA
jgi:signal transduction histidine kinase